MTPANQGRLTAIRLTDVPLAKRELHGRALIRQAAEDGNLTLAVDLERAIYAPSENLYWLPLAAVRTTM